MATEKRCPAGSGQSAEAAGKPEATAERPDIGPEGTGHSTQVQLSCQGAALGAQSKNGSIRGKADVERHHLLNGLCHEKRTWEAERLARAHVLQVIRDVDIGRKGLGCHSERQNKHSEARHTARYLQIKSSAIQSYRRFWSIFFLPKAGCKKAN